MDRDWTTVDDGVVLITALSTPAVGVWECGFRRQHSVEQKSMSGEMKVSLYCQLTFTSSLPNIQWSLLLCLISSIATYRVDVAYRYRLP
jgi:hypothetical protein